jgi:hypothetical protein
MSKQPSNHNLTGDFISERAVRRATSRRRRAGAVAPAAAPAGGGTVRRATPSTASAARVLRRWSVAELIARAPTASRATA